MADLEKTIADLAKKIEALEKKNTAQDKAIKDLTAAHDRLGNAVVAIQEQLSDNPTALDPHTIKWLHTVLEKWHGGDRPADEPESELVPV